MDTSHIELNMYTGALSLTEQEGTIREVDLLLVSCAIQESEAETSDGRTASLLGRSAASIDAVETRNGAVNCEAKIPHVPEKSNSIRGGHSRRDVNKAHGMRVDSLHEIFWVS